MPSRTPIRHHSAPLTTTLALLVWGFGSLVSPPPAFTQGVESVDPDSEAESEREDAEVWLGVQIGEDDETGAPVQRVLEDSPAERAEIRAGDRILEAGGTDVEDLASLREALGSYSPGDELKISLRRDGERRSTETVLSIRPSRGGIMRNQLVGSKLPKIRLDRVTGDASKLRRNDLMGKPVILEFWATWCLPCRATAETLRKLDDSYGDEIRIVGISREKRRTIRKYARNAETPYPLARDAEGRVHERLFVSSYPTLVVADADGEIVEVFLGRGHEQKLRSLLDRMLE